MEVAQDGMSERSILVGLIGRNIQNSLSPALHDDAFAAAGLRGYYHLMDLDLLAGRSLPDLIAAIRAAGFAGINVTYPCKEAVLPLLDDITPEARQIGAVNTVTIANDGRTLGHNTDRIGFRSQLRGDDRPGGNRGQERGGGRCRRRRPGGGFRASGFGAASVAIHDTDRARAAALVAGLIEHLRRRAWPI